jgi:NADH dehydrogenase
MRVLLTGGTGFVGRAVLARLHAAGHEARVLARQPASPRAQALARSFAAELMAGDVLEPESLRPALADIEAVLHLVGIISEVGRNTFDNAHRVATENVVRAAEAAGIRRYVHLSALGTRAGAVSRYHQTKWMAEEFVRASRLAWTILRPSLIYGPGDQFVNRFAQLSRWSPVLPVFGTGRARLQPVAVETVATALVRALSEPRAVGATYDLCGPTPLSFVEVLDTILASLGRRRFKVRLPLGLMRGPAAVLEFVWPRLLGQAAPLNRDQLAMLAEDNVGDPGPAQLLFDLPIESFRAGLDRLRSMGSDPYI